MQYVVGPTGRHISGIANKHRRKFILKVFLDKLFLLIYRWSTSNCLLLNYCMTYISLPATVAYCIFPSKEKRFKASIHATKFSPRKWRLPTNNRLLESNLYILNIAYLKNSKLRQAFGKKNLSSCLNHSLLIAVSCVKKRGFVKWPNF